MTQAEEEIELDLLRQIFASVKWEHTDVIIEDDVKFVNEIIHQVAVNNNKNIDNMLQAMISTLQIYRTHKNVELIKDSNE